MEQATAVCKCKTYDIFDTTLLPVFPLGSWALTKYEKQNILFIHFTCVCVLHGMHGGVCSHSLTHPLACNYMIAFFNGRYMHGRCKLPRP